MATLFVRLLIILILFSLGALFTSLTANSALAIPLWFIAVTAWTLYLGFRRALFIIIPFLLVADVLWDGHIGPLFLWGFLLATAATYLTLRIETQSYTLKTAIYALLVSFFSAFVIWTSTAELHSLFLLPSLLLTVKTFGFQILVTTLFIIPLSELINKVESWLDTSYKEQLKQIR